MADRIRMLAHYGPKLDGVYVRVPAGRVLDVSGEVPRAVAERWVDQGLAAWVDDPLAGVPLASPAARRLAREAGLSAADFEGRAPSSDQGHTADDVRTIRKAKNASGEQGED
ncbi:MAG: E3 binding domain-containing protein [Gemmatimonadota bacterium]